MAELDNIASQLLKSASEADKIYSKTRDQSEKDKATRLRVIVQNLKTLTLGASDLNGLSDVTISAPANAQVLAYNSTSGQWVNQNPTAGTTPTLAQVTTAGNTTTNNITVGPILIVGSTSSIAQSKITIESSARSDIILKSSGSLDATFTIYAFGGAYGSSYAQFGTNDGVSSSAQGGAIYTDSRGGIPPIRFTVKGTGTTSMSTAMSIYTTTNVGIGTTTDAGYKLDVNGTVRFGNGLIFDSGVGTRIFNSNTITYQSNNASLQHTFSNFIGAALSGTIVRITNGSGEWGNTSANSFLNIAGRAAISSGTNNITSILISNEVANTGTYTGTIRGLYYNPSGVTGTGFTHRAIETTSGDVIFNGGNVGAGVLNPTNKLEIFGTGTSGGVSSNVGYNIQPVVAPVITGVTYALQAGTALEIGTYYYRVTYYNAIGETNASAEIPVITTAGNRIVQLNNIPISTDASVIGRKIYRNKVTDGSSYGVVIATLANNTTTTYTDSTPDTDPIFSGSILTRPIYSKANTTARYITVSGTRSMILDPSLTTFGVNAGQNITVAPMVTLFGVNAGQNITYGGGNTLFGANAGGTVTGGFQNVAVGEYALHQVTTGSYNIGIGPFTSNRNNSFSIALGYYTGNSTTGDRNILIGGYIGSSTLAMTDSVIIGHSATPLAATNFQINIANTIYGRSNTGNVMIGTTTDAGYKLDVNGTARVQGNLAATGNYVQFGTNANVGIGSTSTGASFVNNGLALLYATANINNAINLYGHNFYSGNYNATSGTQGVISLTGPPTFTPTSGTAVFNALNLAFTINQTGGANGITRGLYINPTITAAADFRAIEANGRIMSVYDAPYDTTASNANFVLQHSNGSQAGIGITSDGAMRVKAPGGSPFVIISGSVQTWFNRYGHSSIQAFSGDFGIYGSADTQKFRIFNSTGNVLIQNGGTFTDAGYKLDVNGTGRFSGNLELNAGSNGQIFINNVAPRLLFGKTGTPRWSMYSDTENAGQFEIGSGAGFPYNNFSRYIYLGTTGQGGIGLFGIPNGNTKFLISGSTNAQSNLAQGVYFNNTLVAAANNDVLVGLDINPTFTNGAFTGVQNLAVRIASTTSIVRIDSSVVGSFHGIEFSNSGNIDTEIKQRPSTGEFRISNGRFAGWGGFITLYTDTAERMRIGNNGNVLVGTTTDAGYKLDVAGTVRAQVSLSGTPNIIHVSNLQTDGGPGGAIAFYTGGYVANASRIVAQRSGSVGQSDIQLETNGVTRLFVHATNGNIGVGTSSPSYPFHISSAAAANIYGTVQSTNASGTAAWVAFNDQSDNVVYRVFGSGASGTQMGIALARSASLMANIGGSGKFLLGTYSNTDFVMGTGNAEKMRIVDSTGNILIATTTDLGNKLEVNGEINSTGYKINNTAGYTGTLVIVTNPPGQQNIDIRGGIIVNVF